MLGILRKDLYDTFLIPKNILSNGFGYLCSCLPTF